MEKTYKFCQSCMMPLSQDPQGGGTNADGSKSAMYCSYCYKDGKFVDNMNLEQMREFVVNKMVEMKYPRWLAKLMTMGMPRLERWRQAAK